MGPSRLIATMLALLLVHVARGNNRVRGSNRVEQLLRAGSYGKSETVSVTFDGSKKPLHDIHISYLTLRGLAELPILMLEATSTSYSAVYYGKGDFIANAKATVPLGRVPVLTNYDGDGGILAQSATIVRYLAGVTGLAGGSGTDAAQVDMLYETYKELFRSHATWGKPFDANALHEGFQNGRLCTSVPRFKDTSNRDKEFTPFEKSCMALTTFEDLLGAPGSKGEFMLGGSLSYADLAVFTVLVELDEDAPSWPSAFPMLARLKSAIESRPAVNAYLHSDRRMPKIVRKDNDYVYIKDQFDVSSSSGHVVHGGREPPVGAPAGYHQEI